MSVVRRFKLLLAFATAVVLTTSGTVYASTPKPVSDESDIREWCVAYSIPDPEFATSKPGQELRAQAIELTGKEPQFWTLSEPTCFDSEADAVEFLLEHHPRPMGSEPNSQMSTLSMSDSCGGYIWTNTSTCTFFESGYRVFAFAAGDGCDNGSDAISYVGSYYNDTISSVQTLQGSTNNCFRTTLYEHANFGGSAYACSPNCYSLSWMNDNASSLWIIQSHDARYTRLAGHCPARRSAIFQVRFSTDSSSISTVALKEVLWARVVSKAHCLHSLFHA